MDPGTAISVAQVVCSVAKDLYSYAKDLRGSEIDIKRFQEHLSWLYNVFMAVEKALEHNEVSAQSKTLLQNALLRCRGDALKLSELVKRTKPVDVQPSAGAGRMKSTARKFLYPFRKPSMNELLEQIRACQNQMAFAVGLLQLEKADLSRNRLEETYEKLDNVETIISSAEKERRAERIYDTLQHVSARSRRLAVDDAHADTFKWIFHEYHPGRSGSPMPPRSRNGELTTSNSDPTSRPGTSLNPKSDSAGKWSNDSSFARWLQGEGDVFWIRGKAGSGKSTLMKFIIDHPDTRALLRDWSGQNNLIIAEHFFWLAGDQLQRIKHGMLQNLLYQILKADPDLVPKVCETRWNSIAESTSRWSTAELMNTLKAIARVPEIRVCLFIDGLDECDPEEEHPSLVNDIFNLASYPGVKIVASSRPWPAFDRCLTQPEIIVALEDLTRKDMLAYVCDQLTSHSRGQIPEDMNWSFESNALEYKSDLVSSAEQEANELVNNILDKANGVFLWVSIVVSNLCEHLLARRPLSILVQYVDQFPRKLEDYFRKNILERVHDTWISETAIALKIMSIELSSSVRFSLCWVLSQKGIRVFEDPSIFLLPESSYPASSDTDIAISKVKAFLAGCCKDLFSVQSDGEGIYTASPSIDYLHRTVLDFLQTAETQRMINEHVPSHFSDGTLPAQLTLVANRAFLANQQVVSHLACAFLITQCYSGLLPISKEAVHDMHEYLESLPLSLVREYGLLIAQAVNLRTAERSDVGQPVGHDWEANVKRDIFAAASERRAGLLRDYMGWTSNYSDDSLIQHLKSLAIELRIDDGIDTQSLSELVRKAKTDDRVQYIGYVGGIIATFVQRGLSPVALQLLEVLREKEMITEKLGTFEFLGLQPLLLVALGSDIRGSISKGDIDVAFLNALLKIRFNLYDVHIMSIADSENETIWPTFLRDLIFRHSGGTGYEQPHAVDAIRLLVEHGADLNAEVYLTRGRLQDEASSIILKDPWKEKEGQVIPVLDILKAFLPADDFDAMKKKADSDSVPAESSITWVGFTSRAASAPRPSC